MIHYQPFPKVPPIGFFQPISVDPKDMMTDVEFLLGILKKLNQVIAQVNIISQSVEGYDERIANLENEFSTVKQELQDELNAFKLEVQSMIATILVQANAYTDVKAAQLEDEIDQIVIGNITLYDPTTGVVSPLQTVIDNLYNSSRENALTASEYDTLDNDEPLTATAYDAYELTASQYDQSGKTLLV